MTAGTHAISAWSTVSPYGIGAKEFADGLAAGAAAPARLDTTDGTYPGELGLPVPDFEIRTVLGKTGTRSMDRTSALAITAIRELFDSDAWIRTAGDETELGLVLGTTTGSAQSQVELTREMLINAKPFYVDPSRIPNAVMNGAAALCAIWHQLKGPNATVGGGRAAGLLALKYALRLLDAGRARAMLCGGAEEFSPARAWLEHHSRTVLAPSGPGAEEEPVAVLGEGAGMLLVEPAGPEQARILAVESTVASSDPAAGLARCVRRALSRCGVPAEEVWAVSSTPLAGPLGDAERAAIEQVFGDRWRLAVPEGQPWGDAGAATAPFQIAAVLAAAERDPDARGRVAVVTAIDRDGVLGCAVIRTREGRDQ